MKSNILGCLSLIVFNLLAPALMSFITVWIMVQVGTYTGRLSDNSELFSMVMFVLSYPYFFLTPFVLEESLKALRQDKEASVFYKLAIIALLLLPFGLLWIDNYFLVPSLAASVMIFCFSYLMYKTHQIKP